MTREKKNDCPYCTSKNRGIRETYYNMCCMGCMNRMNADVRKSRYLVEHGGRGRQFSVSGVFRGLFAKMSSKFFGRKLGG